MYEFGDEISISLREMNTSNVSNNAYVASVPHYAYGGDVSDVSEATQLEMHNFEHTDEGYKF